jgi:hypothetical protein
MSDNTWTHEDGCWRSPVGDGSVEVELYDDELDELLDALVADGHPRVLAAQ